MPQVETLPRPKTSKGSLFRRMLKVLAVLIGIGIASAGMLLALMWREHRTAIALPPPTGPFAVGRTAFAWTSEVDTQNTSGSRGQVLVWMWYPAAPHHGSTPAEYLPQAWRSAVARQQGKLLSTFFKRDPAVVNTHSFPDAPIAREQPNYPVVLLRPGASALTTDFTTLAEDLASHGYFVVGFDAPYRTFVTVLPDGRVIPRLPEYNVENANGNINDPLIGKLLAMWVSDVRFVVDRLNTLNDDPTSPFAGRMDLSRLGAVGHSFGGATALQFCHEDSRCKAAIDLDGIPFGTVVSQGLAKPCMFVLSDHSRELKDPAARQVMAEMESIYNRVPNGRWFFVIHNANHFSFSDQILLNSQIVVKLLQRVVKFGGLDGRRGLAISSDCVQSFFNTYLEGEPPVPLQNISRSYPEVEPHSEPIADTRP